MVNIYNDKDKLSIICDFYNHKQMPYGTQKLVYPINSLSIDTDTELIIFRNKIGGELFYTFISELHFDGVQATKENIDKLFNETCTDCCGSSIPITGDVTVDLTEIVNLLKEISDKVGKISGGTIGDISEVLCAIGEVDCALDTILEEEVGHYTTVEECNEMNNTIDNIIGE